MIITVKQIHNIEKSEKRTWNQSNPSLFGLSVCFAMLFLASLRRWESESVTITEKKVHKKNNYTSHFNYFALPLCFDSTAGCTVTAGRQFVVESHPEDVKYRPLWPSFSLNHKHEPTCAATL